MTNSTTPTAKTKPIQPLDRELQRVANHLKVFRAQDLKELVDLWSDKIDRLLDEKLEQRQPNPQKERLLAARDD